MARPERSERPQLPFELLSLVISLIPPRHKGTLGALMSVNKACYELASRKLYAELRVNRRNLAGVLAGLEGLSGACACLSSTSSSTSRHAPPCTRPPRGASADGVDDVPSILADRGDDVPSILADTRPKHLAHAECECPHAKRKPVAKDAAEVDETPEDTEKVDCAECDLSCVDMRYPNPSSDGRKRALLALTRYLTVESVPDCACWQRACPLNKALLPHVRAVKVLASVPQHTVVAFERRRRPS